MPDVGLMKVVDLESNQQQWIDTSSKKTRQAYDKWWYQRQQKMCEMFLKAKIDFASIATDEDYVKSLMTLFKQRGVK